MRVPVVLVREVFVRVRHRGVAMSMGVSSGVHFARRMMFVVEVVLILLALCGVGFPDAEPIRVLPYASVVPAAPPKRRCTPSVP